MDWRSLATTQKQQLAERTTTIDRLNQRLSTSSQQVADLQFQLAEQGEGLAALRTNSGSHASDRLSKLQLQYEILQGNHNQLLKRAEAAEADLVNAVTLYDQREADLRRRTSAGQAQPHATQTLEKALAQSRSETQEAHRLASELKEQLQVAKRENASLRWRARCPGDDQDDEELAPEGHISARPRKQPTVSSYAPLLSAEPPLKPPNVKDARPKVPVAKASQAITRTLVHRQQPAVPTTPRSQPTASPPRKRKRPLEDDDHHIGEQELRDLDLRDFQSPLGKRRRSDRSLAEEEGGGEDDGPPKFGFNAITSWQADGFPGEGYPHEDLRGVADELWEKIEVVRDLWEEAAGKYWQDEFTKKGKKSCAAQCITKKLCGGKDVDLPGRAKLSGGRTLWRTGHEGKVACQDCVAKGWPCFTWYDGNGGELLLLPLHEQDRRRKVEAGFEIRHWIDA
ncbi:hypothetical protein B0A55_04402 [Friedmanniomyces simplex]|uniref:Uncharacterized protein n=1 Tax=Friedmanniomyces simplex TaxID=329884 RepID=A0A4U0XKS4_9PEZI|nr:hypothetical protein B0A55_04402 [Friedmanniomyces simplex]